MAMAMWSKLERPLTEHKRPEYGEEEDDSSSRKV
jgi:hypothetical protein